MTASQDQPTSWEMRLVFQARVLLTETLTVISPLCVGLTHHHELLIVHLPCCQWPLYVLGHSTCLFSQLFKPWSKTSAVADSRTPRPTLCSTAISRGSCSPRPPAHPRASPGPCPLAPSPAGSSVRHIGPASSCVTESRGVGITGSGRPPRGVRNQRALTEGSRMLLGVGVGVRGD